ncbi:ABC transporter substrate-binding protein [Paraburkholderia silvatlantica]|uniref:Spermidine/putrescine transport system substrate-binding protein n=1 Tax=Paraburkholderia silvatlantica TaxID=321895 RepID=A0A2U1A767_9BURK|nr:ABC transporter substrate-binding protein [Paraburkholderia silvatlantica]MBB2931430.1 putative spermidine/putrescine transport system substrate-binding protein [Paraburkholderia silvatlantica]PVY27903.1 putative spermidine/putrescine transport system substrate-binding protein [Paraburkholderia silvatlantica]PXW34750.1 putative spermidine/putrescine transport system substrate-binding protein [Paraburkholderia silvatlantica]PYE20518.1 putative spermidine/putrescine transport system substrate-
MKSKKSGHCTIENPARRSAMKLAAAGAASVAFPFVWTPARAANKRIVIRDDGGIYTKAYSAVYYQPFTKATGIEVIGVQANAEPTAQIKSMVDAGSYTWDMAKISQPAVLMLTSGGREYLERHGLEADPAVSKVPSQYMSPFAVGTNVYSTVLAYRTDAFKGRKAPSSWADLWNVSEFPGRRAMRKYPFDTIEEALMASGVQPVQVYPCNLDRAFASLDKISKHVDVWWTTGAQVEQMLGSGEVAMVATWASRAQSAMANGAPVSIVWNQNIWGCDSWSILKGTPNANACREFIKFATDPKRQAQLVDYFPAGLTLPEAFDYVKPQAAKNCPTFPDNMKSGVHIDAKYWLQNQSTALERFNSWILS